MKKLDAHVRSSIQSVKADLLCQLLHKACTRSIDRDLHPKCDEKAQAEGDVGAAELFVQKASTGDFVMPQHKYF